MRYALIKNKPRLHLEPTPTDPSTFYFNVQSFVAHLDKAICDFVNKIETAGSQERTNSLAWLGTTGTTIVWPLGLNDQFGSDSGLVLCGMVSGNALTDQELAQSIVYSAGTTLIIREPQRTLTSNSTFLNRDRTKSFSGRTIK